MPKPNERPLDPIKEAEAAAALREALNLQGSEDLDLTLDMIEGETSLFEAVDTAVERIVTLNGLIAGLEAAEERLGARRARFEATVKNTRAALEQALTIAGIEKALERPVGTVGLSKRPAALVVVEEAEIPAAYWKAGDPKLDRKALTEALRARDAAKRAAMEIEDAQARAAALDALPPEIPGVTLSNAAPTLNLRIA